MAKYEQVRAEIQRRQREIEESLASVVRGSERLCIVQAPPGSGKTHTLVHAIIGARKLKRRIAVAAQTNAQADDICQRLVQAAPDLAVTRFTGKDSGTGNLPAQVQLATSSGDLIPGPCTVVGTVAKWGLSDVADPFDLVLVDEAWQMSMADFRLLGQIAPRFVLIGDPGQIPPIVSIDASRWETSPRAPHEAAPSVILRAPELRTQATVLSLPASRRLPFDSVELVRPFYDFHFDAWAGPGERSVSTRRGGKGNGEDRATDLLGTGSVVAVTLPTPDEGPPMEADEELAAAASSLVARLLDRGAILRIDGESRPLTAADIGLAATHRVMNTALQQALPAPLRSAVAVDTPERWQGLERPVMLAVHPLSGVVRPSSFDLETGRLCVMVSRHKAGLILLSRDHLGSTLGGMVPAAEQAVGRPDITGRGHAQHLRLWSQLDGNGRVVRL